MPYDNVWLTLMGALIAIVVVIGLAYWFTRYIAGGAMLRTFGMPKNGQMKVLEQIQLGKDQRLAVVQAAGRFLLLGVTPQNLTVLAEFTPEEAASWLEEQAAAAEKRPPDFKQALLDALQNRKQR